MSELIHQLGIDWRLLLSQAVNFLILLVVLRLFAYQPIIKLLNDRRARIKEGLDKADEADRRLKDSNMTAKEKIKEAENQALQIFRQSELKAKKIGEGFLKQTHEKQEEIIRNAQAAIQGKEEEARRRARIEAVTLVKTAIAKTVELDPEKIDEELIKKAISGMEN